MSLMIAAANAKSLGVGVWALEFPPHQLHLFGDARRVKGLRSVLLVEGAQFDEQAETLTFDLEGVVPLNLGSTSHAIAISCDTEADQNADAAATEDGMPALGPGDRQFLRLTEKLPPDARAAAAKLLVGVRKRWPGDLKQGLRHNFSNTPDNFWYVIVQPRAGELSITVRGEPDRFDAPKLELKVDRPGYTRFKVGRRSDVLGALELIAASKKRS